MTLNIEKIRILLTSGSDEERLSALGEFAELGPSGRPLIDLAAPYLSHPDPIARCDAIEGIGGYIHDNLELQRRLLTLLGDSDPEVRRKAAIACSLYPDDQLREIISSMDNETERTHRNAFESTVGLSSTDGSLAAAADVAPSTLLKGYCYAEILRRSRFDRKATLRTSGLSDETKRVLWFANQICGHPV